MKWLGGILMFAAVTAVAQFADLRPDPDRAWVRGAVSVANAGVFLAGLVLFGRGLRQEVLAEVRRERPADGGGRA